MKFYSLTGEEFAQEELKTDYSDIRAIGSLSFGKDFLFFKKTLKVYYIPYSKITRCFRRVMMVPMKMCCGTGDMAVERLIVCAQAGEVLEAPMPDSRAARAALEELEAHAPDAEIGTGTSNNRGDKKEK